MRNRVLTTTSLAIAEGVGMQHKNLMELIRKYRSRLSRFGLVTFETRARLPGQHGGGNTQYALLNEPQATLLLNYMRNSSKVLDFKSLLVEEFYRMKEQLKDAHAPAQLSRMEIHILVTH